MKNFIRLTTIVGTLGLGGFFVNSGCQTARNSKTFGPVAARISLSEAQEEALLDSDGRIDPEFRVPSALLVPVSFWTSIYSSLSSDQYVIFDENHLNLVYEVADFSSLAKTARNRVVYEILVERKLKRLVNSYRKAFHDLAKKSGARIAPTAENEIESKILGTLQALDHHHDFQTLNKGLRIQMGQMNFVKAGFERSESYLPPMEEIFRNHSVPPAITRLSLVESSFNIHAVSKVDAVGVWQFMPKTGKEFLKIDPQLGIDERRSPLKATVAAAQLLKRNRKILRTWPMAVIAYNHGFTALRRVPPHEANIEKFGSLLSSCQKISGMGFASRNFYPEFLAMLHVHTYREELFGMESEPKNIQIGLHALPRPMKATLAAKQMALSEVAFRSLNPDIQRLHSVLPKGFRITAPIKNRDLASNQP